MPTARGIGSALVGVSCLMAGAILGYPELVIVGIGGLLLVLLGLLWVRGPRELELERLIQKSSAARGSDLPVLLAVTNRSNRPFLGGRVGDVLTNQRISGHVRYLSVKVGRVARQGQITTTYRIPTDERGVFDLGPLSYERSDLFGLCRVSSHMPGRENVVVYPSVHDLSSDSRGRQQNAPSRTADAAMSTSVAFDRLREYVVGDDLRRVHWRTSARTGVLMMRETLDEVVDDVTIVIDDALDSSALAQSSSASTQRSEQQARYESVLEIAVSIALHISSGGEQCRVISTSGQKALLNARQPDTFGLLSMLASCVSSPIGLPDAVAELRSLRPGGRVIFISVLRSEDAERESIVNVATELANRHRRALLIQVGEDLPTTMVRSLSIWGVRDAPSLANAWRAMEGGHG